MPINPIIFQIPDDTTVLDLRDAIAAQPGYDIKFDVNGDLMLFLKTSEYRPTLEGEPSKMMVGYSNNFTMHTTRRVGFEFTTSEGRSRLKRLLKEIAKWSRRTKQTVTVRDYHVLEDDEAEAIGYTVRHGILTVIEGQSGSVRQFDSVTSQRFDTGFRVTFWEKELREYF